MLAALLAVMDPTGRALPKSQRPKVIDYEKRDAKRLARAERLARRGQVEKPVVESYDVHGYPDHQFVESIRVTNKRGFNEQRSRVLVHDKECSRCFEERERAEQRAV